MTYLLDSNLTLSARICVCVSKCVRVFVKEVNPFQFKLSRFISLPCSFTLLYFTFFDSLHTIARTHSGTIFRTLFSPSLCSSLKVSHHIRLNLFALSIKVKYALYSTERAHAQIAQTLSVIPPVRAPVRSDPIHLIQ